LGRAGTKIQRLNDDACPVPEHAIADLVKSYESPESIDLAYSQHVPKAHRRRFAQFFTPSAIASLMADWVSENSPKTVLDPALGTGILARAIGKRLPKTKILGYEIDPAVAVAAKRAILLAGLNIDLREMDFLDSDPNERFDGVIANPPYLRHHDLPDSAKRIAQIGSACDIRLSGLTNVYALFLLDCCRRLNSGGRLAFIIPTEWANSNFGKPIKEYLLKHGLLRAIIYVCHTNTIFEDALTTSSILLVEKSEMLPNSVKTLFVANDAKLPRLNELFGTESSRFLMATRHVQSERLLQTSKWDDLFRRGDILVPNGFVPLRLLATTKRGIATGANGFFHVSLMAALERGLREERLIPCIGKANDVTSLNFGTMDLAELIGKGRPTHLINFSGELTPAEQAYIQHGENEGLHQRYLTQKRSPWYSNERIHVAPIWAAVFGRECMRFIVNTARVANLTSFHGVYPLRSDLKFVHALAASLNSRVVQGVMKSEIRVYGGGLNKVEPRDLLDVKVPDLRGCSSATLERLGALMIGQSGSHFTNSELDELDELVLSAGNEAARHSNKPRGLAR
jgi:adenine-specific DNA-methyltransferase